jgi:Glycosyl hydrolases family 18
MASEKFTAFWLGYVPSGTAEGVGPLLGATPLYVDTVALAFSNLYPGNVTCNGFLQKANSELAIRAGIAQIRQQNQNAKILLSIIGTPNPSVGWNTGITNPAQFGAWLANLADRWGLDGFDIDNEDLDTFPGQQFIDTVKGMRQAMPDKIITLDTYIFERDQAVIKALADNLTAINTVAYFRSFDEMTALVEQYATVISPGKISIGVKSDLVGPITQGTSVADTAKLSAWEPSGGPKYGMTLWNLSADIKAVTGQPDGTWGRTIHENMP